MQDKILFIEDLGFESPPGMISNYLYKMKQNGVFEKIKGIWIGNYEHESGIALEQIVIDTLENINIPIIKSDNFGHGLLKTVIPIGTKDSSVMLIGEGPGADEDMQGEPFVGKARKTYG